MIGIFVPFMVHSFVKELHTSAWKAAWIWAVLVLALGG